MIPVTDCIRVVIFPVICSKTISALSVRGNGIIILLIDLHCVDSVHIRTDGLFIAVNADVYIYFIRVFCAGFTI